MIKFTFETFKDDFPESLKYHGIVGFPKWAKHHEMVGLRVKRVYENGEVNTTEDENLNHLIEEHKDLLLSKVVNLYNSKNDTRCTATEYFLPLKNQELQNTISEFHSGASNTKQKMGVRYKFLFESSLFIFEQFVNVSGNYPLLTLLNEDSIEEAIREAAENSHVEVDGIGLSENNEDVFSIVVVDEVGDADTIYIELHELLDHLVAVEMFEYEMSIID